MIQDILPTRERLARLKKVPSSECVYCPGAIDSLDHALVSFSYNSEVSNPLLQCLSSYKKYHHSTSCNFGLNWPRLPRTSRGLACSYLSQISVGRKICWKETKTCQLSGRNSSKTFNFEAYQVETLPVAEQCTVVGRND